MSALSSNNPKALILAAGSGSRLMPYTADKPKCMVSLAGKPLVERQMAVLHSCGITDITILGGYMADSLRSLPANFVLNPNFANTNMVFTMMCARQIFDGVRPVVMCYGDIIYEKRVLESLLAAEGPIAVAADKDWERIWRLRMENPLADAETFRLFPDGKLKELGNKPQSLQDIEGQYMGLVRFDPAVHAALLAIYDDLEQKLGAQTDKFRKMYMTTFIQEIIDRGNPVHVGWTHNGWLEVDTTQDLDTYEEMQKIGSLKDYCNLDG